MQPAIETIIKVCVNSTCEEVAHNCSVQEVMCRNCRTRLVRINKHTYLRKYIVFPFQFDYSNTTGKTVTPKEMGYEVPENEEKEERELMSFGEGIKALNTVGALVKPARLNQRAKEILLELIKEDKENVAIMFKDEDDQRYERFMLVMTWLTNKITRQVLIPVRFNAVIAIGLLRWVGDKKNHYLAGEIDFNVAMQWVTNFWSTRYSQNDLMKRSNMMMHYQEKVKRKNRKKED